MKKFNIIIFFKFKNRFIFKFMIYCCYHFCKIYCILLNKLNIIFIMIFKISYLKKKLNAKHLFPFLEVILFIYMPWKENVLKSYQINLY
jgi:hypothetical protein